jgi:hypothetical protein
MRSMASIGPQCNEKPALRPLHDIVADKCDRGFMLVSGLVVLVTLAADPSELLEDAIGGGARVTLEGQRGALDMSGERPKLVFSVLAHNGLSIPVDAVEIGVLFAASEEALVAVDPSALYRTGIGSARVGVVRQRVAVLLAPVGRAAIEVAVEPQPGQPDPQVFRTHVLGYHLGQVTAAVVLDLLGTQAGADEVAAVETLAIAGAAAEKSAVRARWGGDAALVAGFVSTVNEPLPAKPALVDVLRRVYAVRALGVLGGDAAGRTLKELMRAPALASLDEPLLVLLTARLVGSRLETPTAFAVPPTARRMTDVVTAALDDVAGPKDEPMTPPRAAVPNDADDDAGASASAPVEPTPSAVGDALVAAVLPGGDAERSGTRAAGGSPAGELPWPWVVISLLALASVVSVIWWWSRRRRG